MRDMGWRRRHQRAVAPGVDRGAAAVETAIVLPLILLLTFGIIAFGFLLRDYVGVSSATRDAVRTASAGAQKGATGTAVEIASGHRGDGSASFAYDASQVFRQGQTAIPQNTIIDMWVYLANRGGFPASSVSEAGINATTGDFSSCPGSTCVRYAWQDDPDDDGPLEGGFLYQSGLWDPATINACAGDPNAMSVGVLIRVDHGGPLSGLFGTDFVVSDSSVLRFEPLRNFRCSGSVL